MKKIILANGLIAGAIVSGMLLLIHPLVENGTVGFDYGMVLGYASMVISLSMVFFGIKTYRDQYNNGVVSFGQAFKIGILIALVASLLYAVTWEFYYNFAAADFTEKYTAHYLEKMSSEGASSAELADARAEMESFNESYKNPLIRFGFTLMEILPVGVVITLISAAILRKREFLPA